MPVRRAGQLNAAIRHGGLHRAHGLADVIPKANDGNRAEKDQPPDQCLLHQLAKRGAVLGHEPEQDRRREDHQIGQPCVIEGITEVFHQVDIGCGLRI